MCSVSILAAPSALASSEARTKERFTRSVNLSLILSIPTFLRSYLSDSDSFSSRILRQCPDRQINPTSRWINTQYLHLYFVPYLIKLGQVTHPIPAHFTDMHQSF